MNLPDITLLFQMVHFVVAYLILRRFVFAPALIIIEQDEYGKNQLLQRLEGARRDYQDLEHRQRARWSFIQQSLCGMIPKIRDRVCINWTHILAQTPKSDIKLTVEQKESIKKKLHDTLLDVP